MKTSTPDSSGITLAVVETDPEVVAYLSRADKYLDNIGFTEHGERHAHKVSKWAKMLLIELGYPERLGELAEIAGYLHDLGNVINREHHEQASAFIAYNILKRLGMNYDEICVVQGAIGNHEEDFFNPISATASALTIADKADVHRSRVRDKKGIALDIHDRVNYAVTSSTLDVNENGGVIALELKVDTTISGLAEYFEIFLERMLVSKRAAEALDVKFKLTINDQSFI